MTVASHRPSSEPGYFMLTLSPGESNSGAMARDVTVAVDVSGSMSGVKISQARAAVRQTLNSLGRQDRFRLIAFNSGVTTYRNEWTQATGSDVDAAQRWVDDLRADGGTNIADALRETFRMESSEGRLPIVLFLTDGIPSVGEQNPERIADQADRSHGRGRVFAFGVGYDVNTYLLDRLSVAGRGSTQYVEQDGNVEQAVGQLVAKISRPVLTDLEIVGSPARFSEVYPARLPDLFAGEELVIFGRYAADADRSGAIEITGRRNGRQERFDVDVRFPGHELSNDYLPKLWAARKIGALTQTLKLQGGNTELEREIRETALRYGILSEFTSYLVQEEMLADGRPRPVPMDRAQRSSGDKVAANIAPGAMGAPSAPASVGRQAVVAAEAARARREAKTKDELDQLEAKLVRDENERGAALNKRQVGGRWFSKEGTVWVNGPARAGVRAVTIAPFSPAYFALVQALPEIKPYLVAFEEVQLAGRSVTIRVGQGGLTQLDGSDLARLVREFRQ